MKMQKRVLSVLACLILSASLSIEAFASLSPFFNTTTKGYNCTGTGHLFTSSATATLTATLNPDLPHIPSDECNATVGMAAYDGNGYIVALASDSGTTFATVTYAGSAPLSIVVCDFTFTGTELGLYTLRNS